MDKQKEKITISINTDFITYKLSKKIYNILKKYDSYNHTNLIPRMLSEISPLIYNEFKLIKKIKKDLQKVINEIEKEL